MQVERSDPSAGRSQRIGIHGAQSYAPRPKEVRNRVSKEIGALMAQKKASEAEARKAETRQIGEKIGELDKAVAAAERARDEILLRLPNLPHSSVAVGRTSADNPEVRSWGEKPAHGFKPRSH